MENIAIDHICNDQPVLDIQPDDYKISDCWNGYYVSQLENSFNDFDDCIAAIVDDMNQSNFWPNVWYVNDHGNVDLLAINADTGDYETVSSWV